MSRSTLQAHALHLISSRPHDAADGNVRIGRESWGARVRIGILWFLRWPGIDRERYHCSTGAAATYLVEDSPLDLDKRFLAQGWQCRSNGNFGQLLNDDICVNKAVPELSCQEVANKVFLRTVHPHQPDV